MATDSVPQNVESVESPISQLPAKWQKMGGKKQTELFAGMESKGYYQDGMKKLEDLLTGMPFELADNIRDLASRLGAMSFAEGYVTGK